MQPQSNESHASQAGFEQGQVGATPNSGERIPVLPTPQEGIEKGADHREQTADAAAAVADAAAIGTAQAQPVQPVLDDPAAILQAATTGIGPAVAANDDVIEKEWVDKAKKILEATKDDPHARTAQVNELQKDYLKKRYGKELGAST